MNKKLIILLLLLLAGIRFVNPSQISFINDEPQLIHKAISDNQNHNITSYGLRGTRGTDYGPLAIWFYRATLKITSDLVTISILKNIAVSILTILSLLWLMQSLPFLKAWLIFIPILSPYLWFYSRDLWDNSFTIPLCGLFLASYISFMKDEKNWKFFLAIMLATLSFLTHLFSLSIILAITTHVLLFKRNFIFKRWYVVLFSALFALALAAPYLHHLLTMKSGSSPLRFAGIPSLIFSLFGARIFSSVLFDYFLGKFWYFDLGWQSAFSAIAVVFSFLAFPAFWLALWRQLRWIRKQPIKRLLHKKTFLSQLKILIIIIFISQTILNFLGDIHGHPHYYSAVWANNFIFIWIGLSLLLKSKKKKLFQRLNIAYTISLLISLFSIIVFVQKNGGSKALHYGSSLKEQIIIARELNTIDTTSTVEMKTMHLKRFPLAMQVIRKLYPPLPPYKYRKTNLSRQSPNAWNRQDEFDICPPAAGIYQKSGCATHQRPSSYKVEYQEPTSKFNAKLKLINTTVK